MKKNLYIFFGAGGDYILLHEELIFVVCLVESFIDHWPY